MMGILALPEVQSGVVPFVAALMTALVLRPLRWHWAAAGAVVGFYACAYLVTGLEFTPLTSTRKLLLSGLAAVAVGLMFDLLSARGRFAGSVLFVLGGAAVLWVLWPVLMRREGAALVMLAAGSVFYVGSLAGSAAGLADDSLRSTSAAVALGLGTGASAIIGASALLGQLGIALGTASGAMWLLSMATNKVADGYVFSFPILLLGGLLGIAGVVYARIPWFCLLPLVLIPLLAHTPIPASWPRWLRAFCLVSISALPAAAAVFFSWRAAGSAPY